jgi:hypothetical protein
MWALLKLMFNKGLGQKPPDTKPPNNELYKLFIYLLIGNPLRMIQAKFGLNWPSGFRGKDF